MVKILGYELKKTQKPVNKEVVIPKEVEGNFTRYMESMKELTGKNDIDILKETFKNPWYGLNVEETSSYLRLDANALGKDNFESGLKKDPIEEFIRLRKNFSPISTCVDYVKQQLIGGGIDAMVNDPKNSYQQSIKKDVQLFLSNVYQDDITFGFDVLLPILIDNALTTGVGVAEICYLNGKTFWDYSKVMDQKNLIIDHKNVSVVDFDIIEPMWSDLGGIKRLKIFDDGYKRFIPKRNNKTMEINYWMVDPNTSNNIEVNGEIYQKPENVNNNLYLHNWQLFYLPINRRNATAKSESIILPAYSIAIILERILQAVGEGTSRAGFKKFFIIMGTEKRPWGGPFIRNVMQQLKESREKNWSTIPMPQGFDIKEMGGEVFDAKEVVEYCLKLIAKAMNVPCKVLGVSVSADVDANPDSGNFEIWKTNLLSAIRNQLFKRHIWALRGKSRKIQGGTEDDSYIPSAIIISQDILTLKEKTEFFTTLMNIANPLDPLIKYKNQIELCKSLGWQDVLLYMPTLEEYAKNLEEQKELQKKALEEDIKNKAEKSEELEDNEGKSKNNPPLGEKMQGEPKPQTEEQQEERLKQGVNVRKSDSKKGKIESKP